MYRHLTNYTLNKRHHQYVRCDDESTGSKRSFAFLDNYIQENLQSDPQIIWRRIRNLIVKTMIIGAPHINHAYRLFHRGSGRPTGLSYPAGETVRAAKGSTSRTASCSQTSDRKAWNVAPRRIAKNGSNSSSTGAATSATATPDRATVAIRSAAFEILGFDIMLDRNLRPWLIEVNRSPSFGCDQELDLRVKSGLLRDALHLINIRPSDKQMAEEAMKMRSIRRLLSASPSQTLLSSAPHDSTPLHSISPKSISTGSNKPRGEAYVKHGGPNSQDLAADWLQKPSELYRRIRELRERLFEMQRESELECFENANCGNWRRAYPTSDRVLEQRYARLLTNAFLDFNKGSEGDLLHVIQLAQPGGQQEDEIRRHLEFMEREASKLQSNVPAKKVDSSTRRLVRGASGEGGKTAWDERTVNGRQCQEVELRTTRRARQVYRVNQDSHQQLQRRHSATNNNKNSARNSTASSRSYVIVENPSQLQKPTKTAPKPRRCPAKCTNRSCRARLSNEKQAGEESVEGEDFVNVEGGEDDSETLAVRSSGNYAPDVYGESSEDSSEDASWSPRNYFGYRGHLGIEFFTDNAMAAMCAYPRNPLGIEALQKRTMSSGRNTIRF
ncbi:hypothetical protein AAHC03_022873 [Spirometra sp. Aus1]